LPDGDELVKRLVDVGLTLNEARCYVALLRHPSATAAEVAEASGVPRPKIYSTLKTLEQRSFCVSSGSTVTRFRAVDPALALTEWIRGREHDRQLSNDRDRHNVDELITMLPEPSDAATEDLEAIMQLMHGPHETVRMLEELLDRAGSRVDIIHAPSTFQPESRWNAHEQSALQRGVRVRILVPSREFAERRRCDELAAAGAEVRRARTPALKLLLRDGVEAIVTLSAAKATQPSVVAIRHADLVAPLQLLFNREWRRATPLYQ